MHLPAQRRSRHRGNAGGREWSRAPPIRAGLARLPAGGDAPGTRGPHARRRQSPNHRRPVLRGGHRRRGGRRLPGRAARNRPRLTARRLSRRSRLKILHTADLHIGLESHGPTNPHTGLSRRLEDFLTSLDRIVDAAITERVDLVVMAGDIYKGREPNPTHQREFARRVFRLTKARIPVFLLAGNHDLPNAVSRATSIDIFHELDVGGVTVARRAGLQRVVTPTGPILIAALPWVTRSTALAHADIRSLAVHEFERVLVDLIVRSADELAEQIQAARADRGLAEAPAILVAHLHAQEARDGAERLLTVGTDPLVPIQRIALAAFDYVALGHIHAHQDLWRSPPAVYPGSIERINFGEEQEEKGFVIAEIARGSCEWRFVPLPARRFITIDVNAPTDDPTETTLRRIERRRDEIPDAVIRVRVRVSDENRALFDEARVRQALADGFWIAEVRADVDRPARRRLAGIEVERKSPMELLEDYFTEREVPADERARLRQYAALLLGRAD
ncbi:MAG: exonuclease subunit SbcD [Chloroflexi bacterium]|nr:exonuclease subunit SbcD [Chloroflexota bacterium]